MEASVPQKWLVGSYESRNYLALNDWELSLHIQENETIGYVGVALNRGDTAVYPESAEWLTGEMRSVSGARLVWDGAFTFPIDHLERVEDVVRSRCRLVGRNTRTATKEHMVEYLESARSTSIEASHHWKVRLAQDSHVDAHWSWIGTANRFLCKHNGKPWDGTSDEPWAHRLVPDDVWRPFRDLIRRSHQGKGTKVPPDQADSVLRAFATTAVAELKRYEGSWTRARAQWRSGRRVPSG